MSEEIIRVWSVFGAEDRLVLAMSDEPGEFNFARMPAAGVGPLLIPYATVQCYDVKEEAQLLGLTLSSQDADELITRLEATGYRVIEGRPRTGRFARL